MSRIFIWLYFYYKVSFRSELFRFFNYSFCLHQLHRREIYWPFHHATSLVLFGINSRLCKIHGIRLNIDSKQLYNLLTFLIKPKFISWKLCLMPCLKYLEKYWNSTSIFMLKLIIFSLSLGKILRHSLDEDAIPAWTAFLKTRTPLLFDISLTGWNHCQFSYESRWQNSQKHAHLGVSDSFSRLGTSD